MDVSAMQCHFGNNVEGGYATTNVSYLIGIATNSADPEMAFKFISALYTDSNVYDNLAGWY